MFSVNQNWIPLCWCLCQPVYFGRVTSKLRDGPRHCMVWYREGVWKGVENILENTQVDDYGISIHRLVKWEIGTKSIPISTLLPHTKIRWKSCLLKLWSELWREEVGSTCWRQWRLAVSTTSTRSIGIAGQAPMYSACPNNWELLRKALLLGPKVKPFEKASL